MRLLDAKLLEQDDKALRSTSLVRIPRNEIQQVIHTVSARTGIPVEDLHSVGSTGKTDTSGDIDLAVDENKYTPFKVHERMLKWVGPNNAIYNKGTRIGSYAVPFDGSGWETIGSQRVQVDLMFTDNIEWAKFAYFSAGNNSRYKGAVRTILLSAVAAALDEDGVDTFHYDGDELIVRVGRGIDLGIGLKRIFQMRPKRKSGDGYLKSLQKVTPDDIKKEYPDLQFDGTNMVINDPAEVVQVLFGPSTRPANVETAEDVIDLIKRLSKKKQEKIFKIAKIRAKPLVTKGIDVPQELL